MKRLLILGIVVAAIAILSLPAFAEVQNVKVSGDVDTAGVYRQSYDLKSDNQNVGGTNNNEGFIFTQARVKIDADLTDNVAATVRFLTEYDWNTEDNTGNSTTPDRDDVDLDLANITLKELFFAPLTVTVGRQELRYGNAFVIGDPDTNTTSLAASVSAGDLSLRKSFDAIKAVFDYDPLVVDVIYAKIDETNASMDDEDLYGINVAYDIGQYNSEVEAYWLRNRDTDDQNSATATSGINSLSAGDEIDTIGVRGSMTPIDNLNLLGELAWQRGDYDNHSATKRDQDALAYQVAADYTFPDFGGWGVIGSLKEQKIKVGWTHYSGEEVDNLGDHGAWIPLYEDQTHGVVANYIFGGINGGQNSNADILNVGGSLMPLDDLKLSVDFYYFWLDKKLVKENNAPVAPENDGVAWTNLTETSYYMNTKDSLGYEIDLALNYDYTEDVKLGLCGGWFKPGEAFDGANGDNTNTETAIQVLATLDVAF